MTSSPARPSPRVATCSRAGRRRSGRRSPARRSSARRCTGRPAARRAVSSRAAQLRSASSSKTLSRLSIGSLCATSPVNAIPAATAGRGAVLHLPVRLDGLGGGHPGDQRVVGRVVQQEIAAVEVGRGGGPDLPDRGQVGVHVGKRGRLAWIDDQRVRTCRLESRRTQISHRPPPVPIAHPLGGTSFALQRKRQVRHADPPPVEPSAADAEDVPIAPY